MAWKQRQILEIIYCCSFVYNRFIAAVFFSVHFFCLLPRQFIYLRDNVWSSLWHDCMLNANRKWLIKCNSQTIFPPCHVASRNRSRVMTRLRNQAIEISPINRLKEVAYVALVDVIQIFCRIFFLQSHSLRSSNKSGSAKERKVRRRRRNCLSVARMKSFSCARRVIIRAMTRTLSRQRFAPTSKRTSLSICPIFLLSRNENFCFHFYDFIMPIF